MTTEALPFPVPATEECQRGTLLEGQESSEPLRVENGDMAKKVALTTSPDDSWGPPSDGALISFEEDAVMGHPFTSVRKDGPGNENSLSLLTSSETFKMADDDQGQNGGHFFFQDKIPDPSLEPLKAADTSSLSAQGEDGSHSAGHGKMPEVFSEAPIPLEHSEREEERPHNHQGTHPTETADSLKRLEPLDMPSELGHGEKGSPRGHDRDSSEIWSELQPSDSSLSSQLRGGGESWETDRHSRTPGVASEFPAQPEASGGHKEPICSAENSQDDLLPQSPNRLPQGSNSPSQAGEEICRLFPSHDHSHPSFAEPQGTLDTAADVNEGLKPSGQEMTGIEGERVTGGGNDLGVLKERLLEETPVGNSQERKERVAHDRDCKAGSTSPPLASTDLPSSMGTSCQQRAAVTGSEDTFPEAMPLLSPVATGDTLGPAHGGLAPGRDKEEREGPSAPESRAAGSQNKPLGEVGDQALLESETGEEEAPGDAGPDAGTTREPVGAKVQVTGVPGLPSGIGVSPEDPSEAMVLACAQESLDTRPKEESQDLSGIRYLVTTSELADSQAKPRRGLLLDSKGPADIENQGDTTDPISTAPILDELPGTGGPPRDWMEHEAGTPEYHCPTTETPIEREIRLHLEREELLRQQRGLASSRGTQQYVEVRIKPFLSQSVPASPLAKEKELQWAGVQMQREIQRECQREEALVQLGKVRGAYDRGTPQELQEKKMIFEQPAAPEPLAPMKTTVSSGSAEGTRERSFAETDGATGAVTLASGTLFQPLPERPSSANPFFSLRAKSPQSILEREVQEAQERERELQRQRRKIYGSALPQQTEEASDQEEEEVPFQPERPPCKKLDVTWPPPSLSESSQVNGLHQLERSPRSRQKSALIQRWESGTVGNQESQD